MKKIYLLTTAVLIGASSYAQYRIGNGPTVDGTVNMATKIYKKENNKATGDSLMYFDSEGFYLVDPQDNMDFALNNEDVDGNTGYGNTGWPSPSGDSFQFSFFDDDANETPYTSPDGNFFPNDITPGTDSAYYIAATSWFSSPAQADNWFNFGPITIPANTTGNTLNWFDRHNPAWTEGYDIYVVDMAMIVDPINPSFTDVVGNSLTPDFTRAAINSPSPQPAADTTWQMQSFTINSNMSGKRVFIFINHDMNDGDVLYLDEMWLEEGTLSIDELSETDFSVYPNPSNGEFTINLDSDAKESTTLVVRNVVGQTVINKNIALAGKSKEVISLKDYSKGIYFLTIKNKTVKLIVE